MALDPPPLENAAKRRYKSLLTIYEMNRFRYRLAFLCATLLILTFALSAQQRLLVIGGGERPPEAMKKFVEWSGGNKANLLVITWASGLPDESFESLKKQFLDAGAAKIIHAPTRPLDTAKRAALLSEIANADGIFFSGGDQNRIMDVVADEELLLLLKAKYTAGVPFGGTSAGAAVMSDPMMTGEADLKILDGRKVGIRKGLGLIPNVIFDQHFLIRQRHNRLFGLIIENPRMVGVGIDEDTAVLIEDNRRLTVNGKTQVMFVYSKNGKQPFLLSFLSNGDTFDLVKRQ